MSKYLERSAALRATVTPHYNCAQSVFMPFAPDAGVCEKDARRIAGAFGGGMKRGSVCGAITGGLMALGLFGMDDEATLREYYSCLSRAHSSFDCAALLAQNEAAGGEKKPFCDGMVFECVRLVERLLREGGRIE